MPAEAGDTVTQQSAGASHVAAGVGLSRLGGLLREVLVRATLGRSFAADAFAAAQRIPNVLQNLLGEGALSASFIPVYSKLRADDRHRDAQQVAGAILGLTALATGVFVVLGVVLARPLTAVLTPGFSGDTYELTVTLTRITTAGVGFLVLSAWCLGVLNSHRQFFLSYVAPLIWNLAQIVVLAVALVRDWPLADTARALSWGLLVGGILQFAVQWPAVRRVAPGIRVILSQRHDGTREVRRRFTPAVLGRGVVQLSSYVDLVLASALATGAVAALASAQVLYLLPISLFAISIAAAELPGMAAESDRRQEVGVRLHAALRRTTFFVAFSAVSYIALGDLIVGALYEWRAFNASDTVVVWFTLAAYAVGLPAIASSRILQTSLYALGDTRGPAVIAAIRVAVAATVGLVLMFSFDQVVVVGGVVQNPGDLLGFSGAVPDEVRNAPVGAHLGPVGLAIGSAVASWVELALLQRLAGRSLPIGLHDPSPWRVAGPAAAAFLVAAALKLPLDGWPALVAAPLTVGISGFVYVVGCFRAGIDDAHLVLRPVRRMLWRS